MFLRKAGFVLLVSVYSLNTKAQTAEEIISKYIAFTGGEAQWKKVTTIVTSGTYNYGGIEFPFTAYSKAPNLYKFIVPFKGKYYAQSFNGKTGWKIDAFKNETKKTPLTGKAALAMANEADVELESAFINYKSKGHLAVFEGTDKVDSLPCFKIKFIRNSGDTETYYFDTLNFSLIKKRAVSKNAEMQGGILNTFYSDYHEVDGIKIPFQAASKTDEGQAILTIIIKKAEIDIPIADSEFE
jgi:hypothetical protein